MKKNNFWSDGFTEKELEKVILSILFSLSVLVVLFMYVFKNTIDPNMIYFALGLGGLFVARKAVSYFKPQTYYQNSYIKNEENYKEEIQYEDYIDNYIYDVNSRFQQYKDDEVI